MKKIFLVLCLFAFAATNYAQSAMELAKEQKKQNEFYTKLLNEKPNKDAQKEAKRLTKEGWVIPAGKRSIANQIHEVQLYSLEVMSDDNGIVTKRYIPHTAIVTAGTFNGGVITAKNVAQLEVASSIKTQVASAMQTKIDNAQETTLTAKTMERFNLRAKSIVDESLTDAATPLTIYRRLENGDCEVQVTIVYDKKVLNANMKKKILLEMAAAGDELNGIVDQILKSSF